ncbi:MAG: hypothetical protein ACYS15_21270, partial [Planctomycetota bacterium]
MHRPSRLTAIAGVFAAGIAVGLIMAQSGSGPEGIAAAAMQDSPTTVAKISPVRARPRDFYAPNSEDLAPDEMRVIACGTGMPTARPSQAAAC